MYAVHEEVEELRHRLADTQSLVARLTAENELLRQNATTDTLNKADEIRSREEQQGNVVNQIVPTNGVRPRATTTDGNLQPTLHESDDLQMDT